jgi:hypothetical protein
MKPFGKNTGLAFVSCVPGAAATLCAAAVAFGCGSPAADHSSAATTSAALSTAGQRATGAGHVVIGDARRTFAFTAVRHQDGTVSGEAELFNRATGFLVHGEVICMTVIGNHAWIGAIIKQPIVSFCDGTNMYFHVQDNGEGPERRTDLLSGAEACDVAGPAAVALDLAYCESAGAIDPLPMFPIEDGNIQVHE